MVVTVMTPLNIPVPCDQMSANEFVKSIVGLDYVKREHAAIDAVLAGHVPSWMRNTVPVQFTFKDTKGVEHALELHVTPDYITVGNDTDRLRMPMSPLGAQKLADALDCLLPTTRIVTLIWESATHVPPQPIPPDPQMMSTDRIVAHNALVEATLLKNKVDASRLISGHKKDVVVTVLLAQKTKSVAIFGWYQLNGKPIQPLYLGHENTYADYSHGIRLVSKKCVLDGIEDEVERILKDPVLCVGLSNEGPLASARQPLV